MPLSRVPSSFTGTTRLASPAANTVAITTSSTERLRIDSAGNVGIGTDSPTSASGYTSLCVNNATNGGFLDLQKGGTTYFRAEIDGSNNALLGSGTSIALRFQTNNTERMRITSGGDVGIGTSSPANKLVVSASNPTRGLVAKISNSGSSSLTGAQLHFEQNTIGDWVIGQPAGVDALAIWANRFPAADGLERMRIDSSGNVGIGTSSPASNLHVAGTTSAVVARISATTGAPYSLYTSSGSNFFVGKENSAGGSFGVTPYAALLYEGGAYPMIFVTNAAERMRITSDGNVLIGTTSYTTFSGINNVAVQNPTGYSVASGGTGISYASERIAFNAGQFYVLNESSAGVVLTNGSTAWAAQSDERLKDIIEPIEDALNKVGSIRAVIGKYKSDKNGTRRSFLIAQDIQKVLPEAVEYCKLPTGNDETKYLSVRYTDMIPLLVASIKEQQTLIENLTTRLNALEGK
jgi:hypothetical protein